MWIIKRDDGAYVTPLGSARSYTTKLQSARMFASREAAERECCTGNESITTVAAEMGVR